MSSSKGCIVVLTGETDWLSDGKVVLRSTNGHSLLGNITGSGCMVGSSIATFCAAASISATQETTSSVARLVNGNMLIAALGGYGPFHSQTFCAGGIDHYFLSPTIGRSLSPLHRKLPLHDPTSKGQVLSCQR